MIIREEESYIEKAVTTGTTNFDTIAENGAKLFHRRFKAAYNITETRKIPDGYMESHEIIYLLWEESILLNHFSSNFYYFCLVLQRIFLRM